MRDTPWPAGAYLAEFPDAPALGDAVRALRALGYTRLETYSPSPLDDAPPERRLHYRRTRLPVVVFAAGAVGGAVGYAIQWYANAYSYPLDIGGHPANAIPAFMVATFEGVILVAALAAFFGFFRLVRLPALWHPAFEVAGIERATVDRYWLVVNAAHRDQPPQVIQHQLEQLSPLRVLYQAPVS